MPTHKALFIAVATVFTLAWGGCQGAPLNCASHLRIILPRLFTHCTGYQYSEWTEWQFVKDSIVDVPTSQCDTGQSYSESRNRSVTGNGCVSETETRVVCKFTTLQVGTLQKPLYEAVATHLLTIRKR